MANCCFKLYVKATRALEKGLASVVTDIRQLTHTQKAASILPFAAPATFGQITSLRNTISAYRPHATVSFCSVQTS